MSRFHALPKKHELRELPEVEPFGYILSLLEQFGFKSITWGEIRSWQEESGIDLCHWEKRILIRLSDLYQSSLQKYHHSEDPSPLVTYQPRQFGKKIKGALQEVGHHNGLRKAKNRGRQQPGGNG